MATLEETLPSSWYLDEAIFKLEKKEIFFREWLCVAREEQVPNPADSLVLEVMGESIILLRNHVHELRAFYNVCRHRGARLCAAKESDEEEEDRPRFKLASVFDISQTEECTQKAAA